MGGVDGVCEWEAWMKGMHGRCKKINSSHTHTDREHHPRHRHTHAYDENNTPN